MAEHTFTPGPWKQCHAGRGGCQCGQVWDATGNVQVAIATHISQAERDDLEAQEVFVQSLEEAKANARMIAAAPDMLEALKAAVAQAEDYHEAFAWLPHARAAIAAATGEVGEKNGP